MLDGRQYVLVAAGDELYAFTLPTAGKPDKEHPPSGPEFDHDNTIGAKPYQEGLKGWQPAQHN
jgi:hypothetical protein